MSRLLIAWSEKSSRRDCARYRGRSPTLVSLLLVLCGAMMAAHADGTATLYVARRGWHVDIGLSAAELAAPLDAVAADLPGMSYVFFGFADKHYLLAKHRNAPVLLGALWPGDGIMLVTGLASSPDEAFGAQEVIALSLNAEQLRTLQSFIWKSLRTQNESLSVYQTGPYEGSLYFLAAPKYSASHTCNTWGAEALRAAGFQVHTAGVVFAGQLWSQARRIKQTQDRERPCSATLAVESRCRGDVSRPGTPRLWSNWAVPRRSSWPGEGGCCC
jgi:hypothetical protein